MLLYKPFQRPCTIDRVICLVHNIGFRLRRQRYGKLPIRQTPVQIRHNQMNNTTDIVFCQRFKQHGFVQTVQEFRPERGMQFLHHMFLCRLFDFPCFINPFQQMMGADIGCHNQNGILEVHRASLGIGNPPVIQYL